MLLLSAWAALGWAFHTFVAVPTGWGAEPLRLQWDGRDVEVLRPMMLSVVLLAPVLWIVRQYTLNDLPEIQQHLTTLVRALVIAALALGLSRVVFTTLESHVTAVFLVDTSASMPDEALKDANAMVQEAWKNKGEDNDVKVVAFAKEARSMEIAPGSEVVPPIIRPTAEEEILTTDIQGAMRLAYGLFPQDHVKRIVLITDGNQTTGDLLGETYNARDYGIKVAARTFDYEPRPEALIRGFTFPDNLLVGQPYNLQVEVYATRAAKARFRLWQNVFKAGPAKRVDLEPGINTVQFPTEVFEQGITRYRVVMTLEDEATVDTFKPNNSYTETIEVKGKPKVMYIEGERRKRSYLPRALSKTNIDIETRSARGLPTKMKEYENFDAVILSDVPAMYVSTGQMRLLDQYIRGGGGFVMVGGENSFGPGGYYGTYMERIVPVTFDGEKKRDTPSLALMLVIDKSGSMKGQRIELAKEAAKATVEILQRTDKVGVVAFDDGYDELVPLQSASNRLRIMGNLSRLQPSGGTKIAPALQQAYLNLEATRAALKHIILLSDGESDPANIFTELLPAMQASRITVSTVSVGREADRGLLKRIADGGGGRHYFTADPYSIPKIFTKETSQVSRSQLVEEPFRPRLTKAVQAVRGINFSNAPYLLGYVSTRIKPGAEMILASPYKEPIFARWRRGMGKAAVFTSDVKNRWAVQWLKWDGYPKFWSQVVRDMMRVDTEETFPMELAIENGEGVIRVDAVDKQDAFVNNLKPIVSLKEPLPVPRNLPEDKDDEGDERPDGKEEAKKKDDEDAEEEADDKPSKLKRKTRQFELQQTAPGRYEARFDLTEYGSYVVEVDHLDEYGDSIATSRGSLTWPYPDEYLTLQPNEPLITKTAEIGGGGLNPEPAKLFDPEGEAVKFKSELWPWFLFVALGLLVLDLILRRLRFYGKTSIPWSKVAGRG
ncbi:MAG: hypothetical protein CMH57_00385 [Myxococcales bacterium]|nr:hypothetical protein [Myxococcales bacterium]